MKDICSNWLGKQTRQGFSNNFTSCYFRQTRLQGKKKKRSKNTPNNAKWTGLLQTTLTIMFYKCNQSDSCESDKNQIQSTSSPASRGGPECPTAISDWFRSKYATNKGQSGSRTVGWWSVSPRAEHQNRSQFKLRCVEDIKPLLQARCEKNRNYLNILQ